MTNQRILTEKEKETLFLRKLRQVITSMPPGADIPVEQLYQWRRELGLDAPNVETKPKRTRSSAISITYDGETKTINEWAKITGLSKSLLYTRYRQGLSGEDLFKQSNKRKKPLAPKINKNPKTIKITHNGVTKTLKEWEEETGVSRQLIYNRYTKGITGKDLFKKAGTTLIYQGEELSVKDWAKKMDVPAHLIYQKRSQGLSTEEILNYIEEYKKKKQK